MIIVERTNGTAGDSERLITLEILPYRSWKEVTRWEKRVPQAKTIASRAAQKCTHGDRAVGWHACRFCIIKALERAVSDEQRRLENKFSKAAGSARVMNPNLEHWMLWAVHECGLADPYHLHACADHVESAVAGAVVQVRKARCPWL